MNAEKAIRDLVEDHLADNHKADVVRFVDDMLAVASEVGEIRSFLGKDEKWHFVVPGQSQWWVQIGRMKTKVRMACARLAVLCHESGDPDVCIYGGEGVIQKVQLKQTPAPVLAAKGKLNRPLVSPTQESAGKSRSTRWKVQFMNTMGEQSFTIHPL